MYFYIGYVRMATFGRRYGRETIYIQMLREERKAKPRSQTNAFNWVIVQKRQKQRYTMTKSVTASPIKSVF